MNNKIRSWLLIFFLTMSIFSGMFVTLPNNNIVLTASADEVVWENEYGRLEVWPETSRNLIRQEQYCNITWYKPDNIIDVAFRFNNSLSGGKIQYYNDGWNTVTLSHTTYNDKHYYYYQGFNVEQDHTYRFRWYYNVQPGTSGKWDFMAKLSSDSISEALGSGRYILLDPWYNSNWLKVKDVYIDHTQVPVALTNFPILINLSSTDMAGDVQADLGDIVFTNSANDTIMPHEIDWYEIDPSPAKVNALIWVNVSSVNGVADGSDTHIRMYYKNSGCSNQANPGGTWNSDYELVYHLNETTGATHADDSTSNANNGTLAGSLPVQRSVRIGNGVLFDGTNDVITPVSNGANVTEAGTIEFWVDLQGSTVDQYFCDIYLNSGANVRMDTGGSSKWVFIGDISGNPWSNTTLDVNTTLEQVVYTWDDNDVKMFVSGNQIYVNTSATTNAFTPTSFWFGQNRDGNDDLNALMDEIRASSTRRSDSWIVAGYNTVNNMTGGNPFVTISGEVDWVAGATDPVTYFNVSTDSKTQMTLNWTSPANGNYTYIERNTISGWSRGDGTLLYNATNTGTIDTNVTAYNVYYYRAWAFNESTHNFSAYTSANNHTGPLNPTGINPSLSSGTLNFTWTKGTRASGILDTTVIVRKHNSFPDSISDGTQVYNGSATGYDDTVFNTSSYYTFYGFNNLTSLFSSGVQTQWGVLQVRVFDENTSEAIYNYTVHITNQSGSEPYEIYSANTQIINIGIDNLPTGEDVIVKINASVNIGNYSSSCESWNCTNMTNTTIEYKDRIYIMDIQPNTFYNLSVYLPRVIDVESYIVRVIDEAGYSVEDAKVKFQRYINATVGYEDVGIYHTDANGYLTIDLFPGEIYILEISKSGFYTANPFMYPIELFDINDRYHTFKLNHTTIEPDVVTFNTVILFCSEMGWDTSNDTLHIKYFDKLSETSDITIHVYESYETNLSFNYSYSYTDTYDIDIWVSGLNTSRMHRIKIISMNHTTLGRIVNKSCDIMPIHVDDDTVTEPDLEDAFRDVGGDFSMGWVNMIILFIPSIAILIGIGRKDPGFGVLVAGMYFILCSWYINLVDDTTITLLISMLIPLGVIVIAGTRGKKIT